jgi:hypothetical protein
MTGLRNTGNVNPNPDAVEEFRVVTNGHSADHPFGGRPEIIERMQRTRPKHTATARDHRNLN